MYFKIVSSVLKYEAKSLSFFNVFFYVLIHTHSLREKCFILSDWENY